jgi:hypothetical protein
LPQGRALVRFERLRRRDSGKAGNVVSGRLCGRRNAPETAESADGRHARHKLGVGGLLVIKLLLFHPQLGGIRIGGQGGRLIVGSAQLFQDGGDCIPLLIALILLHLLVTQIAVELAHMGQRIIARAGHHTQANRLQ